jgi:hypothetical protein
MSDVYESEGFYCTGWEVEMKKDHVNVFYYIGISKRQFHHILMYTEYFDDDKNCIVNDYNSISFSRTDGIQFLRDCLASYRTNLDGTPILKGA